MNLVAVFPLISAHKLLFKTTKRNQYMSREFPLFEQWEGCLPPRALLLQELLRFHG